MLRAVSPVEQRETWVREHAAVVGRIELAFERPWATVWRVPTATGMAWMKACAPVQRFEPRLTAALARRWPDRLPEVLAHDPERAWLLLADAGMPLGTGGHPAPWLDVLPAYAELQRGETAHVGEHLANGVPDRRLGRFPALYEAMLEHELPLAAPELHRLHAFKPQLADICAELAAAGIPETTQHDDLHGNNVYRSADALRILDWGDSCISHPFLTFRVTFVHLFLAADDPWREPLRDAYLKPWGNPSDLHRPFELAQRLAPFAHLFVLLRILDPSADDPSRHISDLASTLAECVRAAT